MSRKTLDSSTFGEKVYKSLPKLYRDEDANVNYALKRYLQAMNEGGFKPIIDKSNDLLTIYNPDKVDVDLIPHVFTSFGFDLFNGLPEDYVRKLLPLLGTLYKRKGGVEDVEFLCTLFSGVKCDVEVEEGETQYDFKVRINVLLPVEVEHTKFPSHEQLSRVANEFLPFYSDAIITYYLAYSEFAKFRKNVDEILDQVVWNDPEIEEASFKVMQPSSISCLFGVAKLGEGIFGVIEETADTYIDNIKYKSMEDVAELSVTDMSGYIIGAEERADLETTDVLEEDKYRKLFVLGITKLGEGKLGAYD